MLYEIMQIKSLRLPSAFVVPATITRCSKRQRLLWSTCRIRRNSIVPPAFTPGTTVPSPCTCGEASDAMRYGVGFVLLFIATAFLGGMVAWLARRGVKALGVRPVDRLFGAVFGLARGLALLLVAAVLVSLTPARQATWWTESTGARWLDQALLELHPWLPLPGGKEQSV